jgi:hypothetical protein
LVRSELITDDEDDISANYSHLNRGTFYSCATTPCRPSPSTNPIASQFVSNYTNSHVNQSPSIHQLQNNHLQPSAPFFPYPYPPFMQSMFEANFQSSPVCLSKREEPQQQRNATYQASPKATTSQNSNIITQRVTPNRHVTYPSLVGQNIPQAERSPPFSPIELIPGNEYAPCPIPACKSTKSFKGSRGLKVHASVAHPNYVHHIKNGAEGFIPKISDE